MGLGSLNAIGLGEAREKAAECRKQLDAGKDPIEARDAARAEREAPVSDSMTFERCATLYIAAHEAGSKSEAHRRQWPQSLRDHVFPVLGNAPVNQIDTDMVMKVLGPIWAMKTETASRVRSRIELVLDWATGEKLS
jgi:hypothetical protein